MGGGDKSEPRPVITDQAGVSKDGSKMLYVTDSQAEVADLIGEGPIEGIVSGDYTYGGTLGQTGYAATGFTAWKATGILGNEEESLGFLQSIYWNEVPVVDRAGYYNFTNINVEYVKGSPIGSLPDLSSQLPKDIPANETLDLTVQRSIGERLYGISAQGGSAASITAPIKYQIGGGYSWGGLPEDSRIDAVSKTYSILNKECTKLQIRIRVAGLFENIRSEDAPKMYESSEELLKCRIASTGYGDTKARAITYWIFHRPLFDERFVPTITEGSTNEAGAKKIPWSNPIEETVHGKIDQVYVRNTTLNLSSDYRAQKGFQGWQIKIIRITPESLTSYLRNQTYVDSIVEIYGTKLRYPYSSMVYSKFDAEFFTRIPARSYDAKLLKIKIPNNYDPVKKTYGRSDALNVGLLSSWPEVTVSTRLRSPQQVHFQRGGAFYVSSSTPDIPYPALFKDVTYNENTAALLHFDGANNATTTTSSTNPNYYNLSVSLAGSAKLSTTQKRLGVSSLYINDTGTNTEVTIGAANSFDWGSSSVASWGIECWIYTTSFTDYQMIFTHSGETQYKGIHLQIQNTASGNEGKIKLQAGSTQYKAGTASQSGQTVTGSGTDWTSAMVGGTFVFADSTNAGTITARTSATEITVDTSQTVSSQGYTISNIALWIVDLLSSTALSTNTWTHIAAVRWGATFTIYIDGVGSGSVGSVSETITAPTNVPYIGSYRDTGSQYLKGYIDEFRITIGDTPYKANFTPQSAPFTNPYLITEYGILDSTLPSILTGETGATTQGYNNSTDNNHFWDGAFKQTETWLGPVPLGDPQLNKEWSDNPAWCFYDLITNPRYGLGGYIEGAQVDKWGLYEIGQYCDTLVSDGFGGMEPRFTMNHLLTSKEDAYKVINNLSSVFRGITYYTNGLIFASQDSFKKALYQFNNSNVVDGMFTYASSAKKTRHSIALVRYIDKRNHFRPSIEYVENEEALKRYGIREIQTAVLGCTSRGQARRFGLWLLASEYQETESVSFVVGQDGAYMKPGDVVQIYDQYRTPLKFGGRTNLVEGMGTAPPGTITYPEPVMVGDQYTLGGTEGLVTGNNIVIDNVLEFQPDKIYKLSLLTPTYYYNSSDVSDMNSNSVSGIRRPQLQDLYFRGDHAMTVSGYYNSAYEEGGSGIATQIYFHTGLLMSDNTPIGTGNQLDFDNYVITGYTNNYVYGSAEASYSGGCFSGENLVWSLEPNDPTDPQFISGNFSNYVIINVGENDGGAGTYNVAALEYSTGKYDEVESRLSFATPSIDEVPLWPYTKIGAVESPANYFSIVKGHPNFSATYDSPESKYTNFPTMEVTFPEAGFRLLAENQGAYTIDPKTTTPESMSYLVCHHAAPIASAGFGILSNTFSDFGTDKTVIFKDVNYTSFQNNFANRVLETVDGDINNENRYWLTKDEEGIEYQNRGFGLTNAFKFEALLQQDRNHWVAVFAVNNYTKSTRAVIGVIPSTKADLGSAAQLGPNKLESNEAYTRIEGNDIRGLTSEGIDTPAILNSLTSNQPSFTWNNTVINQVYDDLGNTLKFSDPYNDFRITIREHSDHLTNVSSNILIEITGYTSDLSDGASNFSFLRQYNDPNVISSLPYNADAVGYDIKGVKLEGQSAKLGNDCEWFRVDKTGIIFRNQPNSFPIRTFDIVVEAHDFYGDTSAKNKVWDNTIGVDGTVHQSSWSQKGEDGTQGYDIFGTNLALPDSIVFAKEDIDKHPKGYKELEYSEESWLTPGQAHTREYPYCAQAFLYNNGTLELSLGPSEDEAGNRILAESELKKKFSDVKGLVYYYTTGDNTLIDVREKDAEGALGQVQFYPQNQAPQFEFDKRFTPGSVGFGFQGSVRYTNAADDQQQWTVSVGDMKGVPADVGQPWENNAAGNNQTFRNYYIFPASTNPQSVTIPFPKIAKSNVQNIFLNIGLFDSLSLSRHFEADRTTAKTQSIDNSHLSGKIRADGTPVPFPGEFGKELIPTIFLDSSFNFSTLPTDVYKQEGKRLVPKHWPQLTSGPESSTNLYESFLQQQGTPIFLKERSLQTEGQSALAYRAWFDVTLDPGEINYKVFPAATTYSVGIASQTGQIITGVGVSWNSSMEGGGFVFADDTSAGTITEFISATKIKVDKNQSVGQQGYTITIRRTPLLVDFDSDATYRGAFRVENSPPYNSVVKYPQKNKTKGFSTMAFETTRRLTAGADTGDPDIRASAGYLTLYFDEEYDPQQYTVDVEFKQANYGTSYKNGKLEPGVKISDANRRDGLEKNINPNTRDLRANEYPVENATLVEKARGYIKFFLSPFYIGGINAKWSEEMLSGNYEYVTELWIPGGVPATSHFDAFPNIYSSAFKTDGGVWFRNHDGSYSWWKSQQFQARKEGFVRIVQPLNDFYEFQEITPTSVQGEDKYYTWQTNTTWTGTNTYAVYVRELSYIRKRGTRVDPRTGDNANVQFKNLLVYGRIKGVEFKPGGSFDILNKGSVNNQASLATNTDHTNLAALPDPKVNQENNAGIMQLAAGRYLESRGVKDTDIGSQKEGWNRYAALGNIINVKGGILLSDSLDKTDNTTL